MYVYTDYVKWSEAAKARGLGYFTEEWLPMHGEACDRHGVKLLNWGLPMGVSKDHVYFYETGLEPKKFLDFKGEISRVDGELLWAYSRTVIAVIPE